jgi:hypothetical protein
MGGTLLNFGKKAISTLATAGLLASLLSTAIVGTASAAVGTWTGNGNTYLATCNPANCTQVADGNTQMQLFASSGNALVQGYLTVTGASFANAHGQYVWDSTSGTLTINATSSSSTTGDWVSIKSVTAGTAVISIWSQPNIFTAGTLTGTVSVTFYAAASSSISAANSFAKTVTYGLPSTDCTTGTSGGSAGASYVFNRDGASSGVATLGSSDATLCVFVGSTTAGTGVPGLSVSATISPVGTLLNPLSGAYGQAITLAEATGGTNVYPGTYYAVVKGSGVGGAATITLSSSTLAGGTVALGTQTFTFTGGIAKITAASAVGAVSKSNSIATNAVAYKLFDAAGNRLVGGGSGDATITAVASTGAPFGLGAVTQSTTTSSGYVPVTCRGVEGSGTVTVKYTSTDGLTVITSNAVTVYCSGSATAFTVAFDKTTVAPGGSAVLTATAKDAAGQPAAGYLFVNINSSNIVVQEGAFVSAGTLFINPITDGDQGDGTTTWSYLAPFNTGVITASVTDLNPTVVGSYTNMGTQYASLTVGLPVPVVTVVSHAASALGLTHTGPFTTATKLPVVGKYVTVKFSGLTAGSHVIVLVASKSGTTWSTFAPKSTRIADASGSVYYNYRSTSAAWLSFMVSGSNSTQARWR